MTWNLNETIHQKTRLAIMSHLIAVEKNDFLSIKKQLGLSDGNISIHASILEKAGFIETKKSFHGKKTKTEYIITSKGRDAFAQYLNTLEEMLQINK